MNNVHLIGRLTRDIDLRKTPQGESVGRFNLAVDRKYKNKQGEYDADFINCVVWRQAADIMNRYCKKGTKVAIDGNICSGSYDYQHGHKVYTTEVCVNNFYFVESAKSTDNNQSELEDSGAVVDIDQDDLPFWQKSR